MSELSNTMPAQTWLESQIGGEFLIKDAAGNSVPLQLQSVVAGIPMSTGFVAYSASFVLPPNVSAGQSVYELHPPAHTGVSSYWSLLMTPIMAARDGCHRLEVVFHYSSVD